jgi:multicomponent Na+:H+ antiporter subunit C
MEHAAPHAQSAAQASISIAKSMDDVLVNGVLYSNPLPHVLILTAIVVGVATLAVGLALVVRIREAYGTIEEDELQEAHYQQAKGART